MAETPQSCTSLATNLRLSDFLCSHANLRSPCQAIVCMAKGFAPDRVAEASRNLVISIYLLIQLNSKNFYIT